MQKGYLSEYFTGIGSKVLTRVDATHTSNQHEVGDGQNGEVLSKILGCEPRKGDNRFKARYIWLQDEQETISVEGFLSWYDTRERQAHRSAEWRLYYQTNPVTELMTEGDRLFVARQPDDYILFIVVPADSTISNQLAWLFGVDVQATLGGFDIQEPSDFGDSKLDFISRLILDEIGIEFEDPDANSLDSIIERFGLAFPTTMEFSDLARLTLPEVDARDDPDEALLAWLNHEEAMFRRLEKRIVSSRISDGFVENGDVDVDGFIKFSLGVQNRRKSRMGHSLEHHLKAVFNAFELRFAHGMSTEKGKIPDFVFPGKQEYLDPEFTVSRLTMLAAKSSCKDRWPQILPEAERIPVKHLVTLEPGISARQTTMMQASNVQLIVPGILRGSYTKEQQSWLWSMRDFISLVTGRQNRLT